MPVENQIITTESALDNKRIAAVLRRYAHELEQLKLVTRSENRPLISLLRFGTVEIMNYLEND